MRKNNISYPYPVLRAEPVDFENSCFMSEYKLETSREGYTLMVDFSVSDSYSQSLIKEGKIRYAVHMICKETLFRNMYTSGDCRQKIFVKAGDIHGDVFVTGYLVADTEIDNYSNPDFGEGYKGISFTLHQGDIVGIGAKVKFQALFDKEIITDAASIMQVAEDRNIKYMETDIDNDHIIIKLPPAQFKIYRNLKFDKTKWDIANATIVIPTLVEVLSVMNQDRKAKERNESDFDSYPWFRTLSRNILEVAGKLNISEDELYEHPCRTAQILMNNNSAKVFNLIDEGSD